MQVELIDSAVDKVKADALLIPIFQGQNALPEEAARLGNKLADALGQVLKDGEFRGRLMEVAFVHNLNNLPSKWTVLVGLGKADQFDLVRFRNALQAAARTLRKRGNREIAVLVPKDLRPGLDAAEVARAATEGIALGNFDIGSMKTRHEDAITEIDALGIVGLNSEKRANAAAREAKPLAD